MHATQLASRSWRAKREAAATLSSVSQLSSSSTVCRPGQIVARAPQSPRPRKARLFHGRLSRKRWRSDQQGPLLPRMQCVAPAWGWEFRQLARRPRTRRPAIALPARTLQEPCSSNAEVSERPPPTNDPLREGSDRFILVPLVPAARRSRQLRLRRERRVATSLRTRTRFRARRPSSGRRLQRL